MKPLQVVRRVRREPYGKRPVVHLVPRCLEHPPLETALRARVSVPDLVPYDMVHLARGRTRHLRLRRRPRVQPPQHRPRGRPVLTRPVAPHHRRPPRLRHALEHLLLLQVGLIPKHLAHELDRRLGIVLPIPAASPAALARPSATPDTPHRPPPPPNLTSHPPSNTLQPRTCVPRPSSQPSIPIHVLDTQPRNTCAILTSSASFSPVPCQIIRLPKGQ